MYTILLVSLSTPFNQGDFVYIHIFLNSASIFDCFSAIGFVIWSVLDFHAQSGPEKRANHIISNWFKFKKLAAKYDIAKDNMIWNIFFHITNDWFPLYSS